MSHYSIDGKNLVEEWRNKRVDYHKGTASSLAKKKPLLIKRICGECKNVTSLEYPLEKGYEVELAIGPTVLNENSKNELKRLMTKYPDLFSVYMTNERPRFHATQVASDLEIEEEHEPLGTYKEALIIENANRDMLDRFNNEFYSLVKGYSKATIADISKLGVYIKET